MELRVLAIEDVSFVNLRGEVINRANLINELIKYYNLKLGHGETRVTDFSEGSEIRNLLEAFTVDIYYLMEMENDILRQCFVDTATGAWLDKIGLHPFVQLPRLSGVASTGSVTFSIPSALSTDFVIPVGTVLMGSNGLSYVTDYEAIIPIGDTSVSVNVSCSTVGFDGNLGVGGLTVIDDTNLVNGGLSVTNAMSISGGSDVEDDETYRLRLLDFVRRDDFGSLGYYKTLCENVSGVHDVKLVDDASYTKKVLVNGVSKPTSDAVLLQVLTVLSDLGNTVIGHSFTVDKPVFDSVDLDISVTVNAEMDTDVVKHIVEDLFDGGSRVEGFEFSGLNIDEGVSQQTLYGLFDVIDNITGVTITSGGSAVTDISCTANHVLKAGTISVTQTVG